MTVLFIILGYIASVFISRWANYKLYKKDPVNEIVIPVVWLIPGINLGCIVVYLFTLVPPIPNILKEQSNWFTGKNW